MSHDIIEDLHRNISQLNSIIGILKNDIDTLKSTVEDKNDTLLNCARVISELRRRNNFLFDVRAEDLDRITSLTGRITKQRKELSYFYKPMPVVKKRHSLIGGIYSGLHTDFIKPYEKNFGKESKDLNDQRHS